MQMVTTLLKKYQVRNMILSQQIQKIRQLYLMVIMGKYSYHSLQMLELTAQKKLKYLRDSQNQNHQLHSQLQTLETMMLMVMKIQSLLFRLKMTDVMVSQKLKRVSNHLMQIKLQSIKKIYQDLSSLYMLKKILFLQLMEVSY